MLKNGNVKFEDVEDELNRGIESMDELRVAELGNLGRVRTVKENLYSREQSRLTRKYGAQHPRTLAVATKRSRNQNYVREIEFEKVREAVPPTNVDEKSWLVHGFVLNKDGQGVPRVTVAVYDRKNNWYEDFGYACTDEKGYFKLPVSPLPDKPPHTVFLGVTRNQTRLHSDTQALNPTAGKIDFRELVIDENGEVCSQPNGGDKPKPKPPSEEKPSDTADLHEWLVKGRVTDKSGKGLKGLVVAVYDKDLFFDDAIGETLTDNEGNYSLSYYAEDFRFLIERKADLYVIVSDRNGNKLHDGKNETRHNVGRVEIIDVQIG